MFTTYVRQWYVRNIISPPEGEQESEKHSAREASFIEVPIPKQNPKRLSTIPTQTSQENGKKKPRANQSSPLESKRKKGLKIQYAKQVIIFIVP